MAEQHPISYTGPDRQPETHEEWRKRNLRKLLEMHQKGEVNEEEYLNRLDAIVAYYENQARVDPLTGIANLRQFETQLEAEQLKMIADPSYEGHILFLDADGLRVVNNNHGHAAGDELVKKYAEAVEATCKGLVTKNFPTKPRFSAFAGRVGGDELVVFIGDLDDEQALQAANEIRKKVITNVNSSPTFRDIGWNQTISGGIQRINSTSDLEKARKDADNAAYVAKSRGKNQIVPFNQITLQERALHSSKFK
jgi:diguanylate cyclase (GGDEF)-like protein